MLQVGCKTRENFRFLLILKLNSMFTYGVRGKPMNSVCIFMEEYIQFPIVEYFRRETMSEHDDFDINITQSEDSELTEKEYSDII